jgi:hypothetical protein
VLRTRGLQCACDDAEVANEIFEAGGAGFFVRGAEECGRMHGDHGLLAHRRRTERATVALHAGAGAEDGLGGGAAEKNEEARLDASQLGVEPRFAGGDLA